TVVETAIGFKYIAEEMLKCSLTLLGGEESGGIGYGNHIPERDALLSALYVLEAVATREQDIPSLYRALQEKTNFHSAYDRIDITVKQPQTLIETLTNNCPERIADRSVLSVQTIDGFKLRLEGDSWLLIRFSGTEPLLRLYSEAPTMTEVHTILHWIKEWVERVDH
ncbi:MAG: phosphoglucomutase/phosphomannomutase family protein, partial [Pseudanabaenaceae cyanobacterium]